jgi:hypothetical protein
MHMRKANKVHEKLANRTVKCCIDTNNRGWIFEPTQQWNGQDKTNKFILRGKSDSNYAMCNITSFQYR